MHTNAVFYFFRFLAVKEARAPVIVAAQLEEKLSSTVNGEYILNLLLYIFIIKIKLFFKASVVCYNKY